MVSIKDDEFFYFVTIDGSELIPISKINTVSINEDLVDKIPYVGDRYEIVNNRFIKFSEGRWRCASIHWEYNNEKKFWQFWKSKRIYTDIIMEKI